LAAGERGAAFFAGRFASGGGGGAGAGSAGGSGTSAAGSAGGSGGSGGASTGVTFASGSASGGSCSAAVGSVSGAGSVGGATRRPRGATTGSGGSTAAARFLRATAKAAPPRAISPTARRFLCRGFDRAPGSSDWLRFLPMKPTDRPPSDQGAGQLASHAPFMRAARVGARAARRGRPRWARWPRPARSRYWTTANRPPSGAHATGRSRRGPCAGARLCRHG
jgi:hypothetical protein